MSKKQILCIFNQLRSTLHVTTIKKQFQGETKFYKALRKLWLRLTRASIFKHERKQMFYRSIK